MGGGVFQEVTVALNLINCGLPKKKNVFPLLSFHRNNSPIFPGFQDILYFSPLFLIISAIDTGWWIERDRRGTFHFISLKFIFNNGGWWEHIWETSYWDDEQNQNRETTDQATKACPSNPSDWSDERWGWGWGCQQDHLFWSCNSHSPSHTAGYVTHSISRQRRRIRVSNWWQESTDINSIWLEKSSRGSRICGGFHFFRFVSKQMCSFQWCTVMFYFCIRIFFPRHIVCQFCSRNDTFLGSNGGSFSFIYLVYSNVLATLFGSSSAVAVAVAVAFKNQIKCRKNVIIEMMVNHYVCMLMVLGFSRWKIPTTPRK